MASILFLIETIQRNKFRCNYLKKKKLFLNFFSGFSRSSLNFEDFQKKDDSHSSDISEITDSEKDGQINFEIFNFKGSFGKQHGKLGQTMLKFEWQHLYQIDLWLSRILSCKKFLLLICKISKLFPNPLSAEVKYSLLN